MSTSSDVGFWCHQCGKQISPHMPDLTCPECNGEFIERMENDEDDSPEQFIAIQRGSPSSAIGEPPSTQSSLQAQTNAIHSHSDGTTPTTTSLENWSQTQPSTFAGVRFPAAQNASNQPQMILHHFTNPFIISTGQRPPFMSQQQIPFPMANVQFQSINMDPNQNPLFNFTNIINQFFGNDFGGGSINFNFGIPMNGTNHPASLDDWLNYLFQTSQHRGNPPASEAILKSLPVVKIDQQRIDEKSTCAICKDEFSLDDTAAELPCHHIYHPDCIIKWLKMHNQCPVCRFELPTDDADYELRRQNRQQSRSSPSQHQ